MSFTCLICGGRNFTNEQQLHAALDNIHAIYGNRLRILHGAARGADLMAQEWAQKKQVVYIGVPAEWNNLGRFAGTTRNTRMLQEFAPDMVVAFKGNAGTRHMIKIALDAKVDVWTVGWEF